MLDDALADAQTPVKINDVLHGNEALMPRQSNVPYFMGLLRRTLMALNRKLGGGEDERKCQECQECQECLEISPSTRRT